MITWLGICCQRPIFGGVPHRRVWDRITTAEYVALKDAEEDLRYYENPWRAFKTVKKVFNLFPG